MPPLQEVFKAQQPWIRWPVSFNSQSFARPSAQAAGGEGPTTRRALAFLPTAELGPLSVGGDPWGQVPAPLGTLGDCGLGSRVHGPPPQAAGSAHPEMVSQRRGVFPQNCIS